MAPFLLALIIFGVAARSDARSKTSDIPGDDEDGYQLDVNLYELCHNLTTYDGGMVDFVVENICPLVFGDEEEGSHWPGSGPEILTFTDLVQALTPNFIYQRLIRAMVESTCKSEGKGQRLDSFCRFHRDGIEVSGVDGGSGSGSGSGDGSGDRSGSGDGSGDRSGSGDGVYDFSVYWSSMIDGDNFW
ncbi:uncharacterized protein LOC115925528 [Strongylocentrotus purpuratus]|uniref:Uncharacterized protein n=1 Tax=Strongylocentrotus purpuratus TaxID=7668 RepID=A0A7M7P3D6_STRPU|nr:uncharacterized protein LOC115925528 [Strongylocentrotus purpuratus]